jgi:Family of unknown function (DUF6151)
VLGHPLQCQCGTIKGSVETLKGANRVICYCRDCQAFAHFLGRQAEILDDRGGSDVIQTLPKHVTISRGIEALACMRLTSKGLLRWYAGCCKTPIGNTLSTPKISFIGLLHSCLTHSDTSLDDAFGPVRAWVNTNGAKGSTKPKVVGRAKTIGWFIRTTLRARIDGDYRHTPLFLTGTQVPIVAPRVLEHIELDKVMNAVIGTRENAA